MNFEIHPYRQQDLNRLYNICLLTGDRGKDASHLYKDTMLLGHYYAGPYAVLEPELVFILSKSNIPVGYILGTKESQNFYDRCEKDWFPILRKKYPIPPDNDESNDAKIIRLLHIGHNVKSDLADYSAHLHIDILPEGQGQGMGKKLMEIFINKLVELKVPALHLEVGKSNQGAIKFYEKTGFHIIKEYEHSIAYGMKV